MDKESFKYNNTRISREIKKVVFEDYRDKYTDSLRQRFINNPESMTVEDVRCLLYGYTFTDAFAKDEMDDCLVMDNWEAFSPQEILLMNAIRSSGDGRSKETAYCVISIGQEYEFIYRAKPYCFCDIKWQSLIEHWIDCFEFQDDTNIKVPPLYFDVSRYEEVRMRLYGLEEE